MATMNPERDMGSVGDVINCVGRPQDKDGPNARGRASVSSKPTPKTGEKSKTCKCRGRER